MSLGQGPRAETTKVEFEPARLFCYALRLFYDNGGGPCYVVSIGGYDDGIEVQRFRDGIDAHAKYDEPTIILFPGATKLANAGLLTHWDRAEGT